MKIIQHPYVEEGIEYSLCFRWRDGSPGHGFSFPCDKDGNVDTADMNPAALDNFRKCLCGDHDVVFEGVDAREWSYRHPRIGRCDCGEEITLDRFTNTCYECGADYNMSGQRLAPREQWGEETGEHWTDCY
jgi:hypothetical protein